MNSNAQVLARGETFHGPTKSLPTSGYSADSIAAEGKEVVFIGADGRPLYGRIMRNVSGGTIAEGLLVTHTAGYRNKRFGVVTASAAKEAAGVIDSELLAHCRNHDLCIVFYKGRHEYSVSDAQTTNIAEGDVLVAQDEGQASTTVPGTAASSTALIFDAADTTGDVETGYMGLCLMNAIGRAAEGVTYTTGVDTLKLADFNIR